MAHKVIDRCKETTSTTGTGTLTLTGPAAGFVAVADAAAGLTTNGDTSWFVAESGSQWEEFLGTRVDATHLARTTVLKSSNGGALVNFTSPPVVFGTVPAERISTVGPAFRAYLSADQTGVTSATFTKVALNTEEFDVGGCFDSTTNYRYTPNVAGYYFFEWTLTCTGSPLSSNTASLRKNGAEVANSVYYSAAAGSRIGGSRLIYMNGTTDYVELFGYVSGTALKFVSGLAETSLSGHFVRA